MADWHTLVELKKRDLDKTIDETLRQLNLLINKPQPNLREISVQMNNLIGALKKEVDAKMNEIKTIETEAQANDGFFRSNYDYGKGFYSNMASEPPNAKEI